MASLFSRLLGRGVLPSTPPEQKRSAVGPLVAFHDIGRPVWTPRSGTALTQAGYRQNAVVYRCVRLISEAAASVAINVFEAANESTEHPVSELLSRPNPREAGSQFFESLYGYLLLNGNAYLELVSLNNVPTELYALRPDRMKVIPGPDGWPEAYEYTVGVDKHIFRQNEGHQPPILHLKLFDPLDDQYGMPPLVAGQMALDTHNIAASWNKALLDNSARPSGALVYASDGANISDTQFDRLKEELESAFQGSANAGRPILLEGGLDWKPLSMSPKDMDFMEAKGMAAREIALAFGVPPLLLGLPGDNTYANYAEANRAFWRQSVLPLVNRTFGSLAHWLEPSFGGAFRLEPDLDRIEALSTERAALWARVDAASFLDRNEKRAAVGYGEVEGVEAEIAVSDMADEAGVEGDADVPSADAEAQIATLKARLYDLEAKYPGQPHDEIGRFTFGRGAQAADASSSKPAGAQLAQANSPQTAQLTGDEASLKPQLVQLQGDAQYTVNLEEEKARGGHALRDHVGKSDRELMALVKRVELPNGTTIDLPEGSFGSEREAEDYTNQTLDVNRKIVDDVVREKTGKHTGMSARYETYTGKEAYMPGDYPGAMSRIRKTFSVTVVIESAQNSPRGYRVITAYPMNTIKD